eukprot:743174-Prymnesium_polylepis.1
MPDSLRAPGSAPVHKCGWDNAQGGWERVPRPRANLATLHRLPARTAHHWPAGVLWWRLPPPNATSEWTGDECVH